MSKLTNKIEKEFDISIPKHLKESTLLELWQKNNCTDLHDLQEFKCLNHKKKIKLHDIINKYFVDKQKELFNQRSKKLKKIVWKNGIKKCGIQHFTGLSHANSDEWQLNSDENILQIKPIHEIKWKKNVPHFKPINNIPIIFKEASQQNLITNKYTRQGEERYLVINYKNKTKKILIKSSKFDAINKSAQPNCDAKNVSYEVIWV